MGDVEVIGHLVGGAQFFAFMFGWVLFLEAITGEDTDIRLWREVVRRLKKMKRGT